MAITNGHRPYGLNTDINVTPLIDVLLVLLIIFMVIVPVAPRGLEAQVPTQPKDLKQNPDNAVVVQIVSGRSGRPTYKINQNDVAINDLGNRLNAIFSVRGEKVMFIKGDGNLDFSAVCKGVGHCKSRGSCSHRIDYAETARDVDRGQCPGCQHSGHFDSKLPGCR